MRSSDDDQETTSPGNQAQLYHGVPSLLPITVAPSHTLIMSDYRVQSSTPMLLRTPSQKAPFTHQLVLLFGRPGYRLRVRTT